MEKTVVIMMGLQGSGKSTFYEKHLPPLKRRHLWNIDG